jgi:hypothetical protein
MWFITSGAKREMYNNPGYYEFLINDYPTDFDLYSYYEIEKVNKLF